jgi:hypothetical protein
MKNSSASCIHELTFVILSRNGLSLDETAESGVFLDPSNIDARRHQW